jgi:hypothetical protein
MTPVDSRKMFTEPKDWSTNRELRLWDDEMDERHRLPADRADEAVYNDGRVKVYPWKE